MKRMKVRKSNAEGTIVVHPTSGKRRLGVKTGRASAIVNMIKSGQVSFLDLRSIKRMLHNG
jgi:hypothetical protein